MANNDIIVQVVEYTITKSYKRVKRTKSFLVAYQASELEFVDIMKNIKLTTPIGLKLSLRHVHEPVERKAQHIRKPKDVPELLTKLNTAKEADTIWL